MARLVGGGEAAPEELELEESSLSSLSSSSELELEESDEDESESLDDSLLPLKGTCCGCGCCWCPADRTVLVMVAWLPLATAPLAAPLRWFSFWRRSSSL